MQNSGFSLEFIISYALYLGYEILVCVLVLHSKSCERVSDVYFVVTKTCRTFLSVVVDIY